MPETTNKSRSAQKTRRRINAGNNKKGSRRQGSNGTNTPAPRIIANSIFGLSLKAKPGLEVKDKLQKPNKHRRFIKAGYGYDDYEKMYCDLLQCLQNALKVYKGEISTFDPLASGLEIGMSIYYVTQTFQNNIMPKGFDFNIDRDDVGNYYFTIYKACAFREFWHAFEIKYALKKLSGNRQLRQLFLQIIKCLIAKAGISPWWDGALSFAEWQLEEKINDWDSHYEVDECDEEQVEENIREYNQAMATLEIYRSGEAKVYEKLFKKLTYKTPEAIQKSLSNIRSRSKLVKWMKDACVFLQLPGCINDFTYPELRDEHETGLEFELQVSILWDWFDDYSNMQGECIDAEAQGIGVTDPLINLGVMPFSKELDIEELVERSKWPLRLSDLWNSYSDIVGPLNPKYNKND